MHNYWLFSLFSRRISRTQSFQLNRHISFPALVALKLLVSLISRLVACSARIVADKQTDSTDAQNDYCNPRCACAPRVNYSRCSLGFSTLHSCTGPRGWKRTENAFVSSPAQLLILVISKASRLYTTVTALPMPP